MYTNTRLRSPRLYYVIVACRRYTKIMIEQAPAPGHPWRKRSTAAIFAAAVATVIIACGDKPGPLAFEHDVTLQDGQSVYDATSADVACGQIAGSHTLQAVDIINDSLPLLEQSQFEASVITPFLKQGHTCPTGSDEYVWTRTREGLTPTPLQS